MLKVIFKTRCSKVNSLCAKNYTFQNFKTVEPTVYSNKKTKAI